MTCFKKTYIFLQSFQTVLSYFEIFQSQRTEPNIILQNYKKKITNKSELTSKDLSFHEQYILEFAFFGTELMIFSFHFSLLSKTTPKYLKFCFYPLHSSSFNA